MQPTTATKLQRSQQRGKVEEVDQRLLLAQLKEQVVALERQRRSLRTQNILLSDLIEIRGLGFLNRARLKDGSASWQEVCPICCSFSNKLVHDPFRRSQFRWLEQRCQISELTHQSPQTVPQAIFGLQSTRQGSTHPPCTPYMAKVEQLLKNPVPASQLEPDGQIHFKDSYEVRAYGLGEDIATDCGKGALGGRQSAAPTPTWGRLVVKHGLLVYLPITRSAQILSTDGPIQMYLAMIIVIILIIIVIHTDVSETAPRTPGSTRSLITVSDAQH